jgi:hypothetical protein
MAIIFCSLALSLICPKIKNCSIPRRHTPEEMGTYSEASELFPKKYTYFKLLLSYSLEVITNVWRFIVILDAIFIIARTIELNPYV